MLKSPLVLHHVSQQRRSQLNPLSIVVFDLPHHHFLPFPHLLLTGPRPFHQSAIHSCLSVFCELLDPSHRILQSFESSRYLKLNLDLGSELYLEKFHQLLLQLKIEFSLFESYKFIVVLHPLPQLINLVTLKPLLELLLYLQLSLSRNSISLAAFNYDILKAISLVFRNQDLHSPISIFALRLLFDVIVYFPQCQICTLHAARFYFGIVDVLHSDS